MSFRLLFLTGFVLILVSLIALMPLSFAHVLSGQVLGAGASTYGRIWEGRIYGAAAGRAQFERIDVGLRPVSLLTGQAVFDWMLADPEARGEGEAFAGFSGHGLRDTRFTTTLNGLGLTLPGINPSESISFEIDTLSFGDAGCREAEGLVRTAALAGFAAPFDVQAPLLEGPISCHQGNLSADLSGETGDMALSLRVSISPSGLWRWTVEARLANDRLTPVFSAAGFTQDGDLWRSRGEGQL